MNKDKVSNPKSHQINRDLIGKEIHEIKPVIFGGSPTDHSNKTALSIEKYAEVVAWWNAKYLELNHSNRNV
jgi:hypothetical protein